MKGLPTFCALFFVAMTVSAHIMADTDSIGYRMDDKPSVTIARNICSDSLSRLSDTDNERIEVNDNSTSENRVENGGGNTNDTYRFRPTQLIIPGVLIGTGLIGLESDWLKRTNHKAKEELQEHPHSKLGLDDFSQYAPLATAYGLRLCGIKGLHDYVDLTIISGTAYLLTGLSVYGAKTLTGVERPDGSTRNSFPSGHTATAFAGAEILRCEYWNVSPWIGVAGYVVAAGTGFLRMYNNRHWLTDVVTGAGFGIICAQAAYWLYPVITKTFFRKRYNANIILSPYVSQEGKGLALQLIF